MKKYEKFNTAAYVRKNLRLLEFIECTNTPPLDAGYSLVQSSSGEHFCVLPNSDAPLVEQVHYLLNSELRSAVGLYGFENDYRGYLNNQSHKQIFKTTTYLSIEISTELKWGILDHVEAIISFEVRTEDKLYAEKFLRELLTLRLGDDMAGIKLSVDNSSARLVSKGALCGEGLNFFTKAALEWDWGKYNCRYDGQIRRCEISVQFAGTNNRMVEAE